MVPSFLAAIGPIFVACSTLVAQQASPLVVPQGELLRTRLQQQISSSAAVAGESVKMEALADLLVEGRVVVRKGAPLTATILVATRKAKRGPGGRLTLHIADVEMVDGERLALDTTQAESGGGPGAKAYRTLVFVSIIALSPAGVATALLLHGQEVVLPEGTEIDTRVSHATTLDAQKFAQTLVADQAVSFTPPLRQKDELATLLVQTSPEDARLWVDGKSQGNSSAKLLIKRGLHKIRVRRDGFKLWEQRVVIAGDSLTLRVTLNKQ